MKLCSFVRDGSNSVGLQVQGGVVDVGRRLGELSLRRLITNERLSEAARFVNEPADWSLDQISFLPVIPDSGRVFCLGVNYAEHFREAQELGLKREATKHPMIFLRLDASLAGHMQPIVKPAVSTQLDYECELAVIVSRRGRYIDSQHALRFVAGYSCFNDASVRDWQFHTSQVSPGKNFPSTGSLGPWLVTADEVPDPQALKIETRLNGVVLQSSTTADMIFSVADSISYVSYMQELQPGDIIATGSPAGVGVARKPQLFMKDGDVCEIEIERLGQLVNPIVAEKATPAEYKRA